MDFHSFTMKFFKFAIVQTYFSQLVLQKRKKTTSFSLNTKKNELFDKILNVFFCVCMDSQWNFVTVSFIDEYIKFLIAFAPTKYFTIFMLYASVFIEDIKMCMVHTELRKKKSDSK